MNPCHHIRSVTTLTRDSGAQSAVDSAVTESAPRAQPNAAIFDSDRFYFPMRWFYFSLQQRLLESFSGRWCVFKCNCSV